MQKFIALYDIHWGYERRARKKVPIHAPKALAAVAKFAQDFKPDHLLWGGDILDCGAISHHNRKKRLAVEDLRLAEDAAGLRDYMSALRSTLTGEGAEHYILGNHEDWLRDIVEEYPALQGILDIRALLRLPPEVGIADVGGSISLGKLVFLHGDQLKGGDYVAKRTVETYARNVRFGHFHQYQVASRCSPLDSGDVHTATSVPCLCRRDMAYGGGAPNRWSQGFLWGYAGNGGFSDYVSIITKRGFVALDREYRL